MIEMLPGFTDEGEPCLFDPETSFVLFPEIEFEELEPNTRYFMYGERSGRTYLQKTMKKDYYISFGFIETDRNSRWIDMQYNF